jgi:hypothetical protein
MSFPGPMINHALILDFRDVQSSINKMLTMPLIFSYNLFLIYLLGLVWLLFKIIRMSLGSFNLIVFRWVIFLFIQGLPYQIGGG